MGSRYREEMLAHGGEKHPLQIVQGTRIKSDLQLSINWKLKLMYAVHYDSSDCLFFFLHSCLLHYPKLCIDFSKTVPNFLDIWNFLTHFPTCDSFCFIRNVKRLYCILNRFWSKISHEKIVNLRHGRKKKVVSGTEDRTWSSSIWATN